VGSRQRTTTSWKTPDLQGVAWRRKSRKERREPSLIRRGLLAPSIIDEAHHLRSDVLEDLRLLTNYAMDSDNREPMSARVLQAAWRDTHRWLHQSTAGSPT
jgi:hypothetical protein